ncbi:hypothetical protein GTGU_03613 [Trabulsiella guamensis ATCC 49490]|uniref:Uncharacterized protein n=1 Tax=Trabulsiella guamensis ATCC 49490 TaxID=1005994 RepID=A0A084ZU12_9ENTR|nr:hypothetical protein [Trabulsiella guamensis]KFC00957.1 hypothetical protein GTGU_03613 [Trabulsiella guamensis ATCC 49490]
MYYSDSIIREMQAEKLMALQLDKAVNDLGKQVLETAARIKDGATRAIYYTSCFTDNYQDVCSKLKSEDVRFGEGLYQLFRDRRIVYDLIEVYFKDVLQHKTQQQLEFIKWRLFKLGLNISTSSLTADSLTLGITTTVCLSLGFSPLVVGRVRALAGGAVGVAGLYGYVQQAAESADRLKLWEPGYYYALYLRKLEMMYFIVEPIFVKARAFENAYLSDDDIVNIISRMAK